MKPSTFLLWHYLLNFPTNVSSITFPPLTPLPITVFKHKPGLPTRFLFLYITNRLQLQGGYHTKSTKCVLCLKVGKVLIFFIVKLNNNSISPTKSAQFECITLIKILIKNVNSQHPFNYFKVPHGNDLNCSLHLVIWTIKNF